ncbi:hypothetical protein BJ170DRAFT_594053 [Xylariales sp. AK1849]|nr:hypothetical protein BJ170DRAFT_594053 [Xylariales sp. AK1849]
MAIAAPSATMTQTCQGIDIALAGRVSEPTELHCIIETQEKRSIALRHHPSLSGAPSSASEGITMIQVLNKYPNANFTAKSGGYHPYPDLGNVEGSVLIALWKINDSTSVGFVVESMGKFCVVAPSPRHRG